MKFANATNLYRKSGKAQPTCPGVPWRDLRFRARTTPGNPDDKWEVGVSEDSVMIAGDCGPVGAGHTNGAPQIPRLRS
jgi:hypothetical protein